MSVKYVCRYCRTSIGEIHSDAVNEFQLGFHFLTPAERRDIITYDSSGDVTVKVVCDYCSEAIQSNPELALSPSPLQ
ncbi:anti-sigma-F factor Fin family protein [Paenibacillus thermotolerans]|uniref:anti-sigma-F factor Fin family protein n=1 Tax=Paenibacillus thermotolerans TaxID=3027807 RepID=UPI0023686F73|nr:MULTISPECIES: anti-sigma-F factor Fin family protein [unclassified Paenibacillus]